MLRRIFILSALFALSFSLISIVQPVFAQAQSDVRITNVNKRSEHVDIKNFGGVAQDLNGWILRSEKGNQDCGLNGSIQPNQSIRIYALASDSGRGGINCGFGGPIWNNSERDPAVLINAQGQEVDRSGGGTPVNPAPTPIPQATPVPSPTAPPSPTTPPPSSDNGDDCVIPDSGPWPPCASGGGGGAPNPPANGGGSNPPSSGSGQPCPSSGAWPAGCVPPNSGGGNNPPSSPPPSNSDGSGGCVIPDSGPWPPCATQGGGSSSPAPAPPSNGGGNSGGCVIPETGPWPPCATQGGGSSAPSNPPAGGSAPTSGNRISGNGDDVVTVQRTRQMQLVRIVGNQCERFFSVWSLNSDLDEVDLLVVDTENYSGVTLIDMEIYDTLAGFEIEAECAWSIEFLPISAARLLSRPGNVGGANDDIVAVQSGGRLQVSGNSAERHFAIWAYDATGRSLDLLVNTTDSYSGTVQVPNNTRYLQITAKGGWSLTYP